MFSYEVKIPCVSFPRRVERITIDQSGADTAAITCLGNGEGVVKYEGSVNFQGSSARPEHLPRHEPLKAAPGAYHVRVSRFDT